MCPSCDFISNKQYTLYKQKKRENLLTFITKHILKNKNDINNIKCILDSAEISDEFIRNIPLINGEEGKNRKESNYLSVKKYIYDKMWNDKDVKNNLCTQITLDIIKLLNHSPVKKLKRDREKYKLWISELLFHPHSKIRQTAAKYIYILFYYFFGSSESNKTDAFCTIFTKNDLKIKYAKKTKENGDDELIQLGKNVRHRVIRSCLASLYDMIALKRKSNKNNNESNFSPQDDIMLRSSISCILESESELQFEMIKSTLSTIVTKPLITYNQLLRISNYSSHSSFSNISLLLQTFSNKNYGGHRLFQQYLYQNLIKSPKRINIISKDLLKMDGKIYFNEMLSNIFPKLVFDRDIKTINAVSKYLNRTTADISTCLLHKILPKVLISIYFHDTNSDMDANELFKWIEENLFDNKRKFLSLLKERPSSLVNELIFICGSGLDTDSHQQRSDTRQGAQEALTYYACAINENKNKKYCDDDDEDSGEEDDTGNEERSCLLAQYASEILLGFGQKLNAKNGDEEIIASNKRKTLRSLRAMIMLLDNKLPQFASKIITLLKMAMNDEKLRSQTLSVWKDFFNYLSGKHLAQNFAQIVVTLLNFLELPASLSVLSSPSPPDDNVMMNDYIMEDYEMNDINDINEDNNENDFFALTQNPITSVLQQERDNNHNHSGGGGMDIDMLNNDNNNGGMEQGFLTQAPQGGFLTQAPLSHNASVIATDLVVENTNNAQIILLLKEIIINKKKFTASHYDEIPILPQLPSLKSISDVIQRKLGNQSLDSKLTHITSLLRNESNGIKKMALNTLLYTIQKQRKKMETNILSNIRYEPLLNNLINAILPLTTSKENEILILCANCLGELGAIDFASLNNDNTINGNENENENENEYSDSDDYEDHKEIIILDDDDDDGFDDQDSDLEIIDTRSKRKNRNKKKHKKKKKKKKSVKKIVKKKKKKNKNKLSNNEHKEMELYEKESIPKFIDNINDLALNIVKNYLIPIHRSSNNSTTQDQAQYALQELLNVLQCNLNTPNEYINNINNKSLGVKNWGQFTEDMQELLQPCLRTTFLIKSETEINKTDKMIMNEDNNNNDKVFSNLIYQNGKINVDQWLYKFSKLLLIKIGEMYNEIKNNYHPESERKNHNKKTRRNSLRSSHKKHSDKTLKLIEENDKKLKTFKACLRVKNHTFLTTYLLPFLVYELLKKKNFIKSIIINEIKDVIEYEHINISQQIQLCIHRIFYLIDVLMSWYYKIPTELNLYDRENKENKELKAKARKQMFKFKQLFHLLPYLSLSKAANICKSYSRSIKYFEKYIFECKLKKNMLLHHKKNDNDGRTLPLSVISTGQLSSHDINFWQKIQSETNCIDSMIGISIFRMDTSIEQQALDFETNGKYNKALNCYEQILQCDENNIDIHKKYLKCLLYLGRFSAVINHVKGAQYYKNNNKENMNNDDNDDDKLQILPTLTNMPTQALSTAIEIPKNNNNNNNNNNKNKINDFDDFYIYSTTNINKEIDNDSINDNNNTNTNTIIDQLALYGIESSWRLQKWELLEEFISKCNKKQMETEFECKLGDCLLLLYKNRKFLDMNLTNKFKKELDLARLMVIKKISSCYMEGYHAIYKYLSQLHMLQELTHYEYTYINNNNRNKTNLNISMFPQLFDDDDDDTDSFSLQTSEQQQEKYMNVNNSFYWNERLDRTANILYIREPILSLRRILYSLKNLHQEEAYCWLQLAKEARSYKQLSHANTALVYASKIGKDLPVPYIKWQSFVEKIKLTVNQGEINQSLMKTQKILTDNNNNKNNKQYGQSQNKKERERIPSAILSEMNVLIATWMSETNSYESNTIISKYKSAIHHQARSEEPYFKFATYLDDLYQNNLSLAKQYVRTSKNKSTHNLRTNKNNIDKYTIEKCIPLSIATKYKLISLLSEMLEKYCLSLTYGHKHVFRSLPRLIELWITNGRTLTKITQIKQNTSHSTQLNRYDKQTIDNIEISSSIGGNWLSFFNEWSSDLPEYQFMCILPIITARILSEATHVNQFIETVLIRCLKKYPSQLLWHIALLLNYKELDYNSKRQKSAKRITLYLKKANNRNNNNNNKQNILFDQMIKVLASLIEFTPNPNNKNKKNKQHELLKCPKYLRNTSGFEIIVPTQKHLEPQLSTNGRNNKHAQIDCYNMINPVRIHKFCEKFVTMSSQAQPKKISLIGTDGLQYSFLIKRESRGDMRKDSRLMENCGVINRLFNNNIESRNRNLNVHNYSVICITEQIGMIEWVPNVDTLRNLLNETYTFNKLLDEETILGTGEILTLKELTAELRNSLNRLQKKFTEQRSINSAELAYQFEKDILSKAPKIFHTYFVRNWINCNEWYNARLLYTRSCASWSIVGFIVALGDRHLENILINFKTGECVHVDFDCLFDKAKSFKVPEQVTFRLTNNIIDGFGIIGLEGTFRKTAECVLNVLKNNQETLVQSLKSFIYDPLIENGQNTNMNVQINNVQNRLSGYVPSMNYNHDDPKLTPSIHIRNSTNNVKLSTNGQVQQLINQSSNKQLLAKMFAGWMPFI